MRASRREKEETPATKGFPWLRIGTIVVVVLLVGTAGYLGYTLRTVSAELEQTKTELEKAAARAELLSQRVKEQQSRTTWLEQAKRGVEAQLGTLQQNVEALQKESQELQAKNAQLVDTANAKLQDVANQCNEHLKARDERNAELLEKLKQAVELINTQKADMAKLGGEKQQVEGQLTAMTERNTRCTEDNAKLSAISSELLKKWWDKGVGDVLAQREPLTQVGKVEMEHLQQEYSGKIRDNTIKSK